MALLLFAKLAGRSIDRGSFVSLDLGPGEQSWLPINLSEVNASSVDPVDDACQDHGIRTIRIRTIILPLLDERTSWLADQHSLTQQWCMSGLVSPGALQTVVVASQRYRLISLEGTNTDGADERL